MADVFSRHKRSQVMRAVRGAHTGPEQIVLAMVRALRLRPRLNDRSLPGQPDLVFPRRKKVILVHGCFWHRHRCEAGRSMPASNGDYWRGKFLRNRRRDATTLAALRQAGWDVLVVWECQTRASRRRRLQGKIASFLNAPL